VVVNGIAFVSSFTWARPSYSRWISSSQLILITSQATLVSFVFLALSIYAAGASVRRTWQDKPPSRAQVWLRETFCTPKLWLSFFRRWMRRKLERNPIGWLEQRTWSGRVVTWGWFAVVISLYSAVLTDRHFFRNYSDLQQIMAWLLMGSMALSAAGSFRRERESGVLELLLVSPLSESRIILGRLRGLWGQFFPSVVLLLAIWGYFSTLLRGNEDIPWISFHALTFLALPVIGLYFSLNSRNVLSAFLLTIAVAVLIPMFLPSAFYALTGLLGWHAPSSDDFSGPSSLLQWIFAAICWGKMHSRLKRRDFPLDRKET
jgi:hypothetical protein